MPANHITKMTANELRTLGYVEVNPGEWRKPVRLENLHSGNGPLSVEEKPTLRQQPKRPRQSPNPLGQGRQAENGNLGGRYSVCIIFRVSDRRKRDGFGMAETVADAIIGAVRRFREGDTPKFMGYVASGEWRGGD